MFSCDCEYNSIGLVYEYIKSYLLFYIRVWLYTDDHFGDIYHVSRRWFMGKYFEKFHQLNSQVASKWCLCLWLKGIYMYFNVHWCWMTYRCNNYQRRAGWWYSNRSNVPLYVEPPWTHPFRTLFTTKRILGCRNVSMPTISGDVITRKTVLGGALFRFKLLK